MIQFGIGTLTADSGADALEFGYLQNVSINFSYDTAELHGGVGLYPLNVQTHSASIEGSAEFADINAAVLEKIIGGTQTDGSLAITSISKPPEWSLSWTMTTDAEILTFAAPKCKSSKLGMSFERENFVIPSFDFKIFQDTDGTVFTITSTDWS